MRRLVFALAATCLSVIPASAIADNYGWTSPGWYAELEDLQSQKTDDTSQVGGPFADKDTCLSYLGEHYRAQLAIPAPTNADPEPEARFDGWCAFYPKPGFPNQTADYNPSAS